MYYTKHIFICTNQRDNGKKCCEDANATATLAYFKTQLKKLDLTDIRVNKAGCLGRCEEGPSIVIYPEGCWYTYKNFADIDQIIQTHLLEGKRVDALLMKSMSG